jgi:type IV pilus assembly protein PilA
MLQKIKNRLKEQKGFTLIELLAVIVILGIIAAIAVPSIMNVINNSREDALRADAIQVLNAAKLYVAEEGITSDTDGIHVSEFVSYLELSDYVVTGAGTDDNEMNVEVYVNSGDFKIAGTIEKDGKTLTLGTMSSDAGVTLADINSADGLTVTN